MRYECNNPSCAGREIYQYQNRWVHADSGFAQCNPIDGTGVKATPKPNSYQKTSQNLEITN